VAPPPVGEDARTRIATILTATTLPPAVPFMALWYVSRFATELKRQNIQRDTYLWHFKRTLFCGTALNQDELLTRIFVVGLMLGDALLDDHSFAVKTWRDVANMPTGTLHTIQIQGLHILGYRLLPKDEEWTHHLRSLTRLLMRVAKLGHSSMVTTVDDFLCESMITQPKIDTTPAPVLVVEKPRAVPLRETKPLVIALRPAKTATTCTKRKLPSPAEWSPEQDPIVFKSRRTAGLAIGAERAVARRPSLVLSPWAALMPRLNIPHGHSPSVHAPEVIHSRSSVDAPSASLDASVQWMRQLPFGNRQSH
jgi:hypothetical protein